MRNNASALVSYLIVFNVLFCSISAISGGTSLYAHNGVTISIPTAPPHKVVLDGYAHEEEWRSAAKFNFSSATPREGNVSIYLQYDLTENSLSGAFFIPDITPIVDHDQVSFSFDVNHSALNATSPDDQIIVFMRNGTSEYYIGNSKNVFDLEGRATQNSNDSSRMPQPMILNSTFSKTFSKVGFATLSSNKSWQGEYKIYFKKSPTKPMGFAIQQKDFKTNKSSDEHFTNYPKSKVAQAQRPSSWGDISYPPIVAYVDNVTKFCPNIAPTYSPNKDLVLCSSLNMASIDEDKDANPVMATAALANVINGEGIIDNLSISVEDSKGSPSALIQNMKRKAVDGTFEANLITNGLTPGNYDIVVQPTSKQHNGLVSTTHLIVNPHALTIEDFGKYVGIAATAIGIVAFLPQIRNHHKRNRYTRNMVKELRQINAIYDRLYEEGSHSGQPVKVTYIDREQTAYNLRQKRDEALVMLQNDQISQEQYSLLDSKISDYTSKLVGEKDGP